jgi:hypothetical protein
MVVRCVIVSLFALSLGCASQQASSKNNRDVQDRINFSGGSGDSHEDAIVINGVLKQSDGIDAEYRYISKIHGVKDKNWKLDGQTMYRDGKKMFDVIEITLNPSSEKRIYYFDVTGFPWKRKGL